MSRQRRWRLAMAVPAWLLASGAGRAAESLPPLDGRPPPRDLDGLWAGYDPRRDPLDAEVVREWREGGATYRYVVFSIGTFKGRGSRIAAYYGFPNSDGKLPALLHLHGGGQRAFVHEVRYAVEHGYAGLSINWGGNPMEKAEEGDPNTDWGALDATQKGHNSHYNSIAPDGKTLDPVESPRNSNWFLLVLAARRAVTFLERQPEVDADRIGAHGHSMGGKLATDLAGIDPRVKVAVASCGGSGRASGKLSAIEGRGRERPLSDVVLATIDDAPYVRRVACPIMALAPANDFHGLLDNMFENWGRLPQERVRYAVTPHMNHRHEADFLASQVLWLDQHLKGDFAVPRTPGIECRKAPDGAPEVVVAPDRSMRPERVDVYYSSDPHTVTRFWRDGGAREAGGAWLARCPVADAGLPFYAFANVIYGLDADGARRAGRATFAISSREVVLTADEVRRAGFRVTDDPSSPLIDAFSRGWRDWYRLEWANPVHWVATTRKLKDPKWRGPDGARLLLDLRAPGDTLLVLEFRRNDWGAFEGVPGGVFAAVKEIRGAPGWQTVSVGLADLLPTKEPSERDAPMADWRHVTEFSLRGRASVYREGRLETVEGRWPAPREFRALRWEAPRR